MNNPIFLVSQVLSIVGCALFTISCKQKTQKRMLIIQTIECAITATVNGLLNGFTGCFTTAIAGVRNFFGIFGKNGKLLTSACIIAVFIYTAFTFSSAMDLLPLLATIIYTISLSFQDIRLSKMGIIANAICWGIYDLAIGAYIYVAFNCINIIVCIFEIKKSSQN